LQRFYNLKFPITEKRFCCRVCGLSEQH
jgi:hypothetical protein